MKIKAHYLPLDAPGEPLGFGCGGCPGLGNDIFTS